MKNILIILIWLAFSWFFVTCARHYKADILYEKTDLALTDKKHKIALAYAQEALSLNPHEPNYYRSRARAMLVASLTPDSKASDKRKQQALDDVKKSIELNPQNLVTLRNVAPLFYFISLDYASDPDEHKFHEPYYAESKKILNELKQNYSNDAGVLAVVAKEEAKYGLIDEYDKTVEMIKKLRPDLLEWHESFALYRSLR